MERVAITLPGGQTMLVEPKVGKRVREQMVINRQRDRQLSRELKASGLLPSSHGSQFAGWRSETYHRNSVESDTRQTYHTDKAVNREQQWQSFLQGAGL